MLPGNSVAGGAAMTQVKVYGLAEHLNPIKADLSGIIHSCVVEAFAYPVGKRFHRFFPLSTEDFYYPDGTSPRYTIVEISMFEGRSVEAKKRLFRLLFERPRGQLGMDPADLEIMITETLRHDWGIRGKLGEELGLDYGVEV